MKIVYDYGYMFVLHSSGHVDTYDKNSVEAQLIAQEQAKNGAERDIKTLEGHLDEMSKTEPVVKTEKGLLKRVTRLFRR